MKQLFGCESQIRLKRLLTLNVILALGSRNRANRVGDRFACNRRTGESQIRLKHLLMLVLALCMMVGAAGCPLLGGDSRAKITGQVTDDKGRALPNATVSTVPPTEVVKTDESGYYVITGVDAGNYVMKVSKAGKKSKTQELKIEAGSIFSCGGVSKKIDVGLSGDLDESGNAKTGSIEGTVTDAVSSAGIQTATLTTSPATKETSTDTNGKYVIDEVSAGSYVVTATKSGYLSNASTTVEVKAGEVTTVDVKLTAENNAGSIKGKITNSGGTAIEGVSITTNPATSTKTTDASGNYEITNVSAGDYTITAVKTGYDTGTKSVTVKVGEQADGNMTISVSLTKAWVQLTPGGTPPTGRLMHTVVWDSQNNRMLMFGGETQGPTYKNDLWSYDGTSWIQITPSGTPPSGREGTTAIWDQQNNRMLVFGGYGGSYVNDLWSYNGTSWTQLSPSGTPPSARFAHVAVWDSQNNRMLIFGGWNGSRLSDLWSFNGTSWTQLTPSGTPPSARHVHASTWDPINNRMLVFGGNDGSAKNDLWSYDGTSWIQLSPSGTLPTARLRHTAVWDVQNARMLIFGGAAGVGGDLVRNDLWSFDGTSWTQISPTGTLPSARSVHTSVWDMKNNQMIVFGGLNDASMYYNDLWSY